MLCEKLKTLPFDQSMTDGPWRFIPAFDDRGAWERIPQEKKEDILSLASELHQEPYAFRSASGILQKARTGDRMVDEGPYFQRRRKLCAAAMGVCVSGNLKNLDEVIDGLFCLMEETTWVISAHMGEILPDPRKKDIELFSSQTAMVVTLCCQALEKEIRENAPGLWERIEREMEERILRPFETRNDFWWMGYVRKNLNNWTPWILSGVMLAACFWIKEKHRLAAFLTRSCEMLDRYLVCVPNDGGCDEGAMYWNLSGGSLMDCLEIVETITGGKLTWWDEPKIRAFLQYPALMNLGGGWFVNFADCDARPRIDGERLRTAGIKTHNRFLTAAGQTIPNSARHFVYGHVMMDRLLDWAFESPLEDSGIPVMSGDIFLPELQVRLIRKQGVTLCCKGGNNDESHNHNDVGNFILYVDEQPEIIDAGTATYTARTFTEERYSLWYTRSSYHNLPIIGSWEQAAGGEYRAERFSRLEDGVVMEIAAAYPEKAGIQKFQRAFHMTEDGSVTLEDAISLSEPLSVTWIFLLRNRPEIMPSGWKTGRLQGEIPPGYETEVEEISVQDARMSKFFPGSLWRIKVKSPCKDNHLASFRFKPQSKSIDSASCGRNT